MESSFYTLCTLGEDDDDVMPPAKKGLLDSMQIAMIRRWIEDGAEWPEDLTLVQVDKKKELGGGLDPKDVYASLGLKAGPVADAHKAHSVALPDSEYVIDFVAIPGGDFVMGSPAAEADRNADEGPQQKIVLDQFWMQKTEMIWDIFEMWQMDVDRQRRTSAKIATEGRNIKADAITRPTPPYVDMTFSMGKNGYPAICMTQLAVKTFCMWLSAKTGHFFRLPTEAEWEYACRAGTTTAYHFGDDASKLGDYAWYADNSDFQYQKVGLKKPNPWGLYDMHGNVSEWVLDQYKEDTYSKLKGAKNPLQVPTELYPRVVRGGNWDQDADRLRASIREGSNGDWKQQDPQIPQSVWYHTDALGVGFRLVRASVIPPVEDLHKYWPTAEELAEVPQR
jgi:formylglycine-generating enzyme required for sulfatase activity